MTKSRFRFGDTIFGGDGIWVVLEDCGDDIYKVFHVSHIKPHRAHILEWQATYLSPTELIGNNFLKIKK